MAHTVVPPAGIVREACGKSGEQVSDQNNAVWLIALNMAERIQRAGGHVFDPDLQQLHQEEAHKRFSWWQDQLKRDPEMLLEWRKLEFKLDRDGAIDLTGLSAHELEEMPGPLPAWHGDLLAVLNLSEPGSADDITELCGGDPQLFLTWPWLKWSQESLLERLVRLEVPDEQAVDPQKWIAFFLPSLRRKFREIYERTFVLELNVARAEGRLRGESREERFLNFAESLKAPISRLSLLQEYPVLARILTTEARRWIEVTYELVARLAADWHEIKQVFWDGQAPGALESVSIGVGDTHAGGRSVCILNFATKPLVYKPRSLRKENLFRDFVLFVQQQNKELDMLFPIILEKDGYGWCEFLKHRPCANATEMEQFYRRAGRLLAYLFSLHGSDIHHENLMACGEYPVIIDLECLFAQFQGQHGFQSGSLLDRAWGETLLGTHLLPSRPVGGADGPDLSGFGGLDAGKLTPFAILQMEDSRSDEMRVVKKRVKLAGTERINSPSGHETNSPYRWLGSILQGFREAVENVIQCREELVNSSIWQELTQQSVRYVAWQSMSYMRLLQDSYHPNLLRNAMDREALFDALWTRRGDDELNARLFHTERTDLWNQDIPVFMSSPRSTHLCTWSGDQIEVHGRQAEKDKTEQRIFSFDEAAIQRHLWTIKTSFEATGKTTVERILDLTAWTPSASCARDIRQICISMARQIADRLSSLAFRQRGQAFWVDTADIFGEEQRRYCAEVVSIDTYAGLSGFLLFFDLAAKTLNDKSYGELAADLTRTIVPIFSNPQLAKARSGILGAFSGFSAPLYAFTHVLAAQSDGSVLGTCDRILDFMEQTAKLDSAYDMISGSAGAICSLLNHYEVTGNNRCLEIASACGDRLLETAEPQTDGIAWKTLNNSVPLSGFAHGTAGIAYSLFRLAKATGREDYLGAARAALQYDRSTYSANHGNWLDLRDRVGRGDTVAWCYGAPGIGLARLGQISLGFDDGLCREEVERAFHKTVHAPWRSHNLCHGAFGNLAFLLLAAERLNREDLKQQSLAYAQRALDEVLNMGFLFDSNSETLNFMLGLSGIGYALLRIAFPSSIPEYLLLEAPLRADQKQEDTAH